MKKRLLPLLAIYLLMAAPNFAGAQTNFELPDNITLKEKDDYARYEKDIINASKWLVETDLDKEKSKRKEVASFVVQWIVGSPTVTVDLTKSLGDLYEKNTDLLPVYLANYSRWVLENNDNKNKNAAIKEGLTAMITVYKKGIQIKKNKEMLKMIERFEKGEADAYISEKF